MRDAYAHETIRTLASFVMSHIFYKTTCVYDSMTCVYDSMRGYASSSKPMPRKQTFFFSAAGAAGFASGLGVAVQNWEV